ncbi:hypothetical protein FVE85_4224 [Porphyridium purpureum]|uniref:Uncharacterized protein n=1 Tax=Porphyridium purpureum TaxID=35688 RepID=A0A5J4YS73_PORPP|nr:hypothetical protein FVE85_4224 [Porphyridium purpureum]|eukprot:POR9428..scf229_5
MELSLPVAFDDAAGSRKVFEDTLSFLISSHGQTHSLSAVLLDHVQDYFSAPDARLFRFLIGKLLSANSVQHEDMLEDVLLHLRDAFYRLRMNNGRGGSKGPQVQHGCLSPLGFCEQTQEGGVGSSEVFWDVLEEILSSVADAKVPERLLHYTANGECHTLRNDASRAHHSSLVEFYFEWEKPRAATGHGKRRASEWEHELMEADEHEETGAGTRKSAAQLVVERQALRLRSLNFLCSFAAHVLSIGPVDDDGHRGAAGSSTTRSTALCRAGGWAVLFANLGRHRAGRPVVQVRKVLARLHNASTMRRSWNHREDDDGHELSGAPFEHCISSFCDSVSLSEREELADALLEYCLHIPVEAYMSLALFMSGIAHSWVRFKVAYKLMLKRYPLAVHVRSGARAVSAGTSFLWREWELQCLPRRPPPSHPESAALLKVLLRVVFDSAVELAQAERMAHENRGVVDASAGTEPFDVRVELASRCRELDAHLDSF